MWNRESPLFSFPKVQFMGLCCCMSTVGAISCCHTNWGWEQLHYTHSTHESPTCSHPQGSQGGVVCNWDTVASLKHLDPASGVPVPAQHPMAAASRMRSPTQLWGDVHWENHCSEFPASSPPQNQLLLIILRDSITGPWRGRGRVITSSLSHKNTGPKGDVFLCSCSTRT